MSEERHMFELKEAELLRKISALTIQNNVLQRERLAPENEAI